MHQMEIYFDIKHSELPQQEMNFEYEVKKDTELDGNYLQTGTKCNIHGDEKSCELLTQTLTSVLVNDDRRLSLPSPSDLIRLPVWKFPRCLDPSQHQQKEFNPYDGKSKTLQSPMNAGGNNSPPPQTTKKPSSKRADQLKSQPSVLEAKLEYWYLPDYINTVFLIGENGSGKSLLLSRFCYEKKRILVIEPAKVIYKYESEGPYRGDFHKPVQPTPDDMEIIENLPKKPDAMKMIKDRFKKITKQWEIDFVNNTVYFYRLNEAKDRAAIYLYESVSDGIRQIFRTVLRFPNLKEFDIICLDEPESHLHPSLYCSLIEDIVLRLSVSVAYPVEKKPLSKNARKKANKKKKLAATKASVPLTTASNNVPTETKHTSVHKTQYELRNEMQSTKLVIATHDFQLIDMLSRLPSVHGMVMEINSKIVPHAPKTVADLKQTTHPRGADNQLNSALWCTVHTKCSSDFVFDQTRNKHSLIDYSSALLKCMANITPIVLFCEGEDEQSKDFKLYSLLFDPNKLKIQPSGKGYSEVRGKTNATNKAKDILHQMTIPTSYYGICDRDRNLNIKFEDVAMLPVPEIENLYWIPSMWKHYKDILVELTYPNSDIVISYNKNKTEFWKKFSTWIKESLYYYLIEYAITNYEQKTKTMTPKLPKNTPEKREEIINVGDNFISDINTQYTEFSKEWKIVLEDAKKYSQAWKEAQNESNDTLKGIYVSLLPTTSIEFNGYLSKQSIKTPKELFQAFIQLSEATDENHQGFLSYYYLLNEKRIIHFLLSTIFALTKPIRPTLDEDSEADSHTIVEAFRRVLTYNKDHSNVLRKNILRTFRDVFSSDDFTYPRGNMKADIYDSFYNCDQTS